MILFFNKLLCTTSLVFWVFPDDLVLSRLICQFVGLAGLYLLYSGSSLHGGVCREGHRQQDGILLPTFFTSFLMAEKVQRNGDEENGDSKAEKEDQGAELEGEEKEGINPEDNPENHGEKTNGVDNQAYEESKL